MTQQTTVLPGGAPAAPRQRLSRSQLVACALVALLVLSGAVLFLTRDDAPVAGSTPGPTRASLVTQATAVCGEVTRRGYTWSRLIVEAKDLHRVTPPAADAAAWSAALRALDAAVVVERRAVDARTDAAALRRLAPARTSARADAKAAFGALGVPCPG